MGLFDNKDLNIIQISQKISITFEWIQIDHLFQQMFVVSFQLKKAFLFLLLTTLILSLIPSSTTYFPIGVVLNKPNKQCSAYCMYRITNSFLLQSRCVDDYGTSQLCYQCDPLLFRAVPTAIAGQFKCVPHLYNGQQLQQPFLNYNHQYGFVPPDKTATIWKNGQNYVNTVVSLKSHYAIRIRFGVHLYKYQHPDYEYPFEYSLDGTTYNYNQNLDKYWSPWDIVTSPLTQHNDWSVTISFRLLNKGYPYNDDANINCRTGVPNVRQSNRYYRTDGTCYCSYPYYSYDSTPMTCSIYAGTACNGYTSSVNTGFGCVYPAPLNQCCEFRYLQITDMLVFASRCQEGCLNCTSATYCKLCDIQSGYYLYPEQHKCYKRCPQATYQDNMTYFLGTTLNLNQSLCSTCNQTCQECDNLTTCTKCYASGRNQSFLYNGTCINPCINGYTENYTTHQCWCSLEYHYEINASLLCQRCSIECVFCFGPSNLQCTYCQIGYYLANLTTNCLLQCPLGQYKNDRTRTCFECDRTCSSCQIQSTLCTSCMNSNPIKYLFGQQCLSWCPPGYNWNNITYRCDLCDLYTYSFDGKCLEDCPDMHKQDKQNRSCIHLSKFGYKLSLQLLSVHVLDHGKLIRFQILAQDGLNLESYEAIIKNSYFNVQILYKDMPLNQLQGVRNLMSINLPIRNLQIIGNKIYYTTNLPENIDYHKSFQILFTDTIAGSQNLKYQKLTNAYPINQHPQFMKEYFKYSSRNLYYVIMIPFITMFMMLFVLRLKGVYQLFMETLRVVQIVGILVYSSFPLGQYAFYFLVGCSYANLDFIPNIYGMLVNPERAKNLASYFMASDDMDFMRLNGSVLFFAAIWGVVVIIAKYLFKAKEKNVTYIITFGLDLVEVKVLHSFWSAIIYNIINYKSSNFSVFISFSFAVLLFLAILSRRFIQWKQHNELSPFFFWRVIATLLISLISLANQLLAGLIFTVALLIAIWEFIILHSSKYYININELNSRNYLSQKTFKILNKYDQQVPFNWAISIRNSIIALQPIIGTFVIAVIILLRDSQIQSVIFSSAILYSLLLIAILVAIFIYNFLEERRKYLVQNKLEFLQRKYAKLDRNDTINYEERKRPRGGASQRNLDDEKHIDQVPREMLKIYD